MKPGFYTIMAAQFFSSLADNALLIAAIALLAQLAAPAWMTPLLKLFFVLSYVLLAAFVAAFADSRPKGQVMFITNTIKIVGCAAMLFGAHPLASYAIVGLGAAAYSPAKYGILTELLPPEKLVAANGWIEGLTVGSIIAGTVLGGVLISTTVSNSLMSFYFPVVTTGVDSPAESAISIIMFIYLVAALFGLLLGISSRLAFGCNVGALFSGIASGSLHGWAWLLAGFVGSIVGVRLRDQLWSLAQTSQQS